MQPTTPEGASQGGTGGTDAAGSLPSPRDGSWIWRGPCRDATDGTRRTGRDGRLGRPGASSTQFADVDVAVAAVVGGTWKDNVLRAVRMLERGKEDNKTWGKVQLLGLASGRPGYSRGRGVRAGLGRWVAVLGLQVRQLFLECGEEQAKTRLGARGEGHLNPPFSRFFVRFGANTRDLSGPARDQRHCAVPCCPVPLAFFSSSATCSFSTERAGGGATAIQGRAAGAAPRTLWNCGVPAF